MIGAINRMDSLSVKLCAQILSFHMKDKTKIKPSLMRSTTIFRPTATPILMREAKRLGLNVAPLDRTIEHDLIEINELYSAMSKRHRTDHDEHNHHDSEIVSIHETLDAMAYFMLDEDWHWREGDRTWISTNAQSRWRTRQCVDGKIVDNELHIR